MAIVREAEESGDDRPEVQRIREGLPIVHSLIPDAEDVVDALADALVLADRLRVGY